MAFDLSKLHAHLESIPKQFEGKYAKVGWFPSAVYEDGTPVAYVAAIQEMGAPGVKIPPRPFLKPSLEQNKEEIAEALKDGVDAVARGVISADQVLDVVGDNLAKGVGEYIQTASYQPLSAVTVMLRKWRREGQTITGATVGRAAAAVAAGESIAGVNADPLQDTGLLVNSISHEVGKI